MLSSDRNRVAVLGMDYEQENCLERRVYNQQRCGIRAVGACLENFGVRKTYHECSLAEPGPSRGRRRPGELPIRHLFSLQEFLSDCRILLRHVCAAYAFFVVFDLCVCNRSKMQPVQPGINCTVRTQRVNDFGTSPKVRARSLWLGLGTRAEARGYG